MSRSTVARVFPEHLQHNVGRVRQAAPSSKVMACVKAGAYGHDLTQTALCIETLVDGFAVACIEEALSLRKASVQKPILLLEGPQSADEIAVAAQAKLLLCIGAWHQLDWLASHKTSVGQCWINVDTGMHRLGFGIEELARARECVLACGVAADRIVYATHLACADKPTQESNLMQLNRFSTACGSYEGQRSCANSAAVMAMPQAHHDWVRPGYMLYGGSPLHDRTAAELNLRAAMEFSASVIAIRDVETGDSVGYGGRWTATRPSRIATIAAGYGDGYPRHAPDGTPVLLNAVRSPLAGRVSMDMLTVDITDNPGVRIGTKAVLWGASPGIDEIAMHAGTIGYELLAAMPARVPRRFYD